MIADYRWTASRTDYHVHPDQFGLTRRRIMLETQKKEQRLEKSESRQDKAQQKEKQDYASLILTDVLEVSGLKWEDMHLTQLKESKKKKKHYSINQLKLEG
ncbi:hypothetical protein B9Z55_013161 [Caenorhabditis nigoni]|uniref:Uncharacterized protein n=1 Tax=Caenorhabditis nigoni TaxID=1611254 RepID=A0A2G5U0G0_9PELO|nr:hypothetical protein B9Z55_013161 [Caenorhabditis nigoni]